MAVGTLMVATRTPIRIMPPAMPKMPERKDVAMTSGTSHRKRLMGQSAGARGRAVNRWCPGGPARESGRRLPERIEYAHCMRRRNAQEPVCGLLLREKSESSRRRLLPPVALEALQDGDREDACWRKEPAFLGKAVSISDICVDFLLIGGFLVLIFAISCISCGRLACFSPRHGVRHAHRKMEASCSVRCFGRAVLFAIHVRYRQGWFISRN